MFDDGDRQMSLVVDQTCDVVFGHLRQLFLKDTFQSGQDDVMLSRIVIVHDSKFDQASLLFCHGGLLGKVNGSGCDGRIRLRFGGYAAILLGRFGARFL